MTQILRQSRQPASGLNHWLIACIRLAYDWIRVLVHFNGLELLARSLNSGLIFGFTDKGASYQFQWT
ncbi:MULTISPECIES: hypothetical protein [unclassified Coleofasciculus]|uniref:hypothetical protein n=1 Tax=unclassified Coleofasciculus TaxID=2692782 RepID=UPI0018816317|nr:MULTISPECIES: hypothetical protein [unclassified Coleofasciculus]MBE9128779.1 hypothetical protein [Coleofasciculus sp. LEGE 07081]MBE9151515.1 hypothetical protein [Coleofasciculus sp. LEGE 07092]